VEPGGQRMNPISNYYIFENPGCLLLMGEDCIDFMQRQTTNDITKLQDSEVLFTVLTTANARIIDLLTLLPELEHSSKPDSKFKGILILTLSGYGEKTLNYLKNRIFIMDKVSILNKSNDYLQIELIGNSVGSILKSLGFGNVPAPGRVEVTAIDKKIIHAIGSADKLIFNCRLVFPIELQYDVNKVINDSGSIKLGLDDYNLMRIEAGFPAETRELTEEYTPLEVNLEDLISTTKGCYTGQEVVARQINYDKVTKLLCGLRLDKLANTSDRIWLDGKSIGVVTSVADSPRYGYIALAVVRKPYNKSGTEVFVGNDYSKSIKALCSDLPFRID
jgi:folate-binding protein YgfZ